MVPPAERARATPDAGGGPRAPTPRDRVDHPSLRPAGRTSSVPAVNAVGVAGRGCFGGRHGFGRRGVGRLGVLATRSAELGLVDRDLVLRADVTHGRTARSGLLGALGLEVRVDLLELLVHRAP